MFLKYIISEILQNRLSLVDEFSLMNISRRSIFGHGCKCDDLHYAFTRKWFKFYRYVPSLSIHHIAHTRTVLDASESFEMHTSCLRVVFGEDA